MSDSMILPETHSAARESDPPSVAKDISSANHLKHASGVITSLLSRLQHGRLSVESAAGRQVKFTRDRIHQVSTATEHAALNIMDACDRALMLVDELDANDLEPNATGTALCTKLRDELFGMMGALQFQDITAQQLAHAAGLLDEMESSLLAMSKSFDPTQSMEQTHAPAPADDLSLPYDPNATTLHAETRQSMADDIFSAIGSGKGEISVAEGTQ